jgi:hypothetical protein
MLLTFLISQGAARVKGLTKQVHRICYHLLPRLAGHVIVPVAVVLDRYSTFTMSDITIRVENLSQLRHCTADNAAAGASHAHFDVNCGKILSCANPSKRPYVS